MYKKIILVVLSIGNLTTAEPLQQTAFAEHHEASSSLSVAGKKIPILMYHEVSIIPWGHEFLYVKPKDFEKQLKYLKKQGFQTITFEDFNHLEDFKKPILLTFDDGYSGNYDIVFPLLKKYKMKITIFVVTDLIGCDRMLTIRQINEMNTSGLVSFQSHTISHYFLGKVASSQLLEEDLKKPIGILQNLTGRKPIAIAYPYGDYNSDVLSK